MTDVIPAFTNTTISAQPYVDIIQPYLIAAVTAAVPIVLGWAAYLFQKWTGMKIDVANQDKLTKAAQNEAGKIIAAAGAEVATKSFTTNSPAIAAAANTILSAPKLQEAITATGMTPELMASKVTGELGALQAQMAPSSSASAVVVTPVEPAKA